MLVGAADAAWNAALAGRFYREEFANRPVFLCVDEETLAELAQHDGLVVTGRAVDDTTAPVASEKAVQSLLEAVRPRVRANEPLDAWAQDALAWRRSGYVGPPPFLSILAVTVLAATSLGSQRNRGYYDRLNEFLELPGRSMPRYFDSDIQQLWRHLNEWLSNIERGRRGLPTATNVTSAQANIGWALSQTVLRPTDRARLPLLFNILGLYPGQHVDGQLLVQGLRRSGLAGHGISRRLTQVLDDPNLGDSLATTLVGELAAWDGTLRDESGRRALQLLLTYHQRSRTFGVAARTPIDLAHHSLKVGESTTVPLGAAGELQPLPVAVTAALLEGSSLLARLLPLDGRPEPPAELRLVMTHSDVRVLTPSDQLARWVEVRSAERYRRHLVMVRSALAQGAVTVMRSLAQNPSLRTSVPDPSGWVSYEYEPVRVSVPGTVVGPLAALCPRGEEIVALDGGLPVSARSRLYLTAGPPDVVFDRTVGDGPVQLDGRPEPPDEAAGRLRLAERGLTEGRHEVNIGGAHLTIQLINEHAIGPTPCTLGIRLRAGTSAAGRPWTVPLLPDGVEAQAGTVADIVVQGASVEPSAPAVTLPKQVTGQGAQVRAGGQHYALGDGRAARVFPHPPGWLLGLEPRPIPHMVDLAGCVVELSFAPRWFLRVAQDRASVVPASAASAASFAPRAGVPGEFEGAWQEILPWLPDTAVAPEHADAWNTWVVSVISTDTAEAP